MFVCFYFKQSKYNNYFFSLNLDAGHVGEVCTFEFQPEKLSLVGRPAAGSPVKIESVDHFDSSHIQRSPQLNENIIGIKFYTDRTHLQTSASLFFFKPYRNREEEKSTKV